MTELERAEKLRRERVAMARETAAPQRAHPLHTLQQTRGNAAVGRHLQRRPAREQAPLAKRHAFEFRIGGDVPAALARAAKDAAGDAPLAHAQLRRLQRVARDNGGVSETHRMFLAGLLDADNVRTLSRTAIEPGATVGFSLQSIRAGMPRVKRLGQRSMPAPPSFASWPADKRGLTPDAAPESTGARSAVLAQSSAVSRRSVQRVASSGTPTVAPSAATRVGFVREDGLNLRELPDRASRSLAQLRFGTRVHVVEDEGQHSGWHKVAVRGSAGFVYAPRIHFPPASLIQKDPGLRLIRVKHGQTFWGLVKDQYGVEGNEGTPDQNINHFINVIRAVNKPEAFKVETDLLDDVGNALISGRDASDTKLRENVDLWIPSFGVAAAMDVGSGTVTGEVARAIKEIEQKLADFETACLAAGKYIPGAIARHAGEVAVGLLKGLVDFAIDAAKILATTTAIGALIGALFGGVGAVPGAEIGFEIGLWILEFYGLALLIELVLSMAGNLLSQLGSFISQVWAANGDKKLLDEAGKTLADALGILVSAVLLALAAYLMKKGTKAFAESKFAKTVGETQLAKWLADRQRGTTTRETLKPGPEPGAKTEMAGGEKETTAGETETTSKESGSGTTSTKEGAPAPSTLQERVVQDVLKDAAPGKKSSSRQYEKTGGAGQAQADFAALEPNGVVERPGGVKTGTLADGSTAIVRPTSSSGAPTLEIQPLRGRGKPIKIRYP